MKKGIILTVMLITNFLTVVNLFANSVTIEPKEQKVYKKGDTATVTITVSKKFTIKGIEVTEDSGMVFSKSGVPGFDIQDYVSTEGKETVTCDVTFTEYSEKKNDKAIKVTFSADGEKDVSDSASATVIPKVVFDEDPVYVAWKDQGIYDGNANLTEDSTKDNLIWTISPTGGEHATIDENGKVTFGTIGATYTITATHQEATSATDEMTLHVIELLDVTSDTDFVGKKGDVKIYACEKKRENVNFIATIKPALSEIPRDIIEWDGEEIQVSALEATITRRNEKAQGKMIKVTCGDITKELKQFIFRRKKLKKVTVKANVQRDDSIVNGSFGMIDRADARDSKLIRLRIYYVDGKGWHYDLRERKYDLPWGINANNRVNISAVTVNTIPFPLGFNMNAQTYNTEKKKLKKAEKNFELRIFTPYGKTGRWNYWSESLTIRHENFHLTDWQPRYKKQVQKKENIIEKIVNPVTLKNLSYLKALAEKRNDISKSLDGGYTAAVVDYKGGGGNGNNHEVRAYRDGAPSYIALRRRILRKIRNP